MREIKGFEGIYWMNEVGEIFSKKGKKKPNLCNNGYYQVTLYKNNKAFHFLLHRLICIHFHDNPHNKRTVNHKDRNKLNNHPDNLEWNTYSENHKHAYLNGRKCWMSGLVGSLNHNSKAILMYDLQGNLLKEFDSISTAERDLKIGYSPLQPISAQFIKTATVQTNPLIKPLKGPENFDKKEIEIEDFIFSFLTSSEEQQTRVIKFLESLLRKN